MTFRSEKQPAALTAGVVAAWIAIAAPLTLAAPAVAQPYPADNAARLEAVPIQSLTLTDQQFLLGDRFGARAAIAGVLRVAPGEGPRPVVVLVSGSSGFGANTEYWSRQFTEMGVSTFFLDPLSGRGIVSTAADQSQNEILNTVLDLYQALDVLADHPNVDPERVAVMGFSRGGIVALYSAMSRFQDTWNTSGVEIAAYIPVYPGCYIEYIDDTDLRDSPVRIFHGTADDVVPIDQCRSYVDRLIAAGEDVVLTEFPGAHHAYDVRTLPVEEPLFLPWLKGVGTCEFREESLGAIVDVATGDAFTYDAACYGGGHLAHSPEATEATEAAVRELLRTVFGLE